MRLRLHIVAASVLVASLLCETANAEPADIKAAHEAAAELSAAKGDNDLVTNLIATMRNQIVAAIADKAHIDRDHSAVIFDDILMPEFKLHARELSAGFQDMYAQNFSVDEMHQLTVFFLSPVGKKYLSTAPLFFQEGRALGQAWGKRVATDALKNHAQELRDKGIKL